MSLRHHNEEYYDFNDYNIDEDETTLEHRRQVKKKLDEKMEKRRLKEALKDEFDEHEFDWDNT